MQSRQLPEHPPISDYVKRLLQKQSEIIEQQQRLQRQNNELLAFTSVSKRQFPTDCVKQILTRQSLLESLDTQKCGDFNKYDQNPALSEVIALKFAGGAAVAAEIKNNQSLIEGVNGLVSSYLRCFRGDTRREIAQLDDYIQRQRQQIAGNCKIIILVKAREQQAAIRRVLENLLEFKMQQEEIQYLYNKGSDYYKQIKNRALEFDILSTQLTGVEAIKPVIEQKNALLEAAKQHQSQDFCNQLAAMIHTKIEKMRVQEKVITFASDELQLLELQRQQVDLNDAILQQLRQKLRMVFQIEISLVQDEIQKFIFSDRVLSLAYQVSSVLQNEEIYADFVAEVKIYVGGMDFQQPIAFLQKIQQLQDLELFKMFSVPEMRQIQVALVMKIEQQIKADQTMLFACDMEEDFRFCRWNTELPEFYVKNSEQNRENLIALTLHLQGIFEVDASSEFVSFTRGGLRYSPSKTALLVGVALAVRLKKLKQLDLPQQYKHAIVLRLQDFSLISNYIAKCQQFAQGSEFHSKRDVCALVSARFIHIILGEFGVCADSYAVAIDELQVNIRNHLFSGFTMYCNGQCAAVLQVWQNMALNDTNLSPQQVYQAIDPLCSLHNAAAKSIIVINEQLFDMAEPFQAELQSTYLQYLEKTFHFYLLGTVKKMGINVKPGAQVVQQRANLLAKIVSNFTDWMKTDVKDRAISIQNTQPVAGAVFSNKEITKLAFQWGNEDWIAGNVM